MTPRATYRLQFGPDFGFAEAAALAPYLGALGISHLYAAPVFAAMPGSTHGYDGIDPNQFNPELGGETGFRSMAAAFRAEGMGLILDFVPNHLGVWGAHNRFWLSVLEEGPASPYAHWFDIDWRSEYPGLHGKLLAPVLGESYGTALTAGDLDLRFDAEEGKFAVWAHDTHKLPVRPEDHREFLDTRHPEQTLAIFRGTPGVSSSWAALDELILRQHWRPAKFDLDCDAINYRRFFTISSLAGLRVEDPEVFKATHRLVLDLLGEGVIDGLRIDHIDGLADPMAYVRRLRAAATRPFHLVVEKILAPGERLPAEWEADGTTGYEFANLINGLLIDPTGGDALTAACEGFTGSKIIPANLVEQSKFDIMNRTMIGEITSLATRLHRIALEEPATRDLGRLALRRALAQVIACLDVYRTYADLQGARPEGRSRLARAVAAARRRAPELDPLHFDFLEAALSLDLAETLKGLAPEIRACVQRFQQLTGPVMAKGVEDTAFYRYHRLVALNEVGAELGHFGGDIAHFHRENQARLSENPRMLLASSTHDTKRGEDARARILTLSSRTADWTARVEDWHRMLAPGGAAIDREMAYLFYQMLVGVWPMDWREEDTIPPERLTDLRERVVAALVKSAREAARQTRWVFGDPEYEAALEAFVSRALDPVPDNAFLRDFRKFEAGLFDRGVENALIQTTLKLTVPGIPDIYQGAELWEQSMVDPDNRRPVDFTRRAAMLSSGASIATASRASGAVKLALIARLLGLRRDRPALFAEGSYQPLETGDDRVLAFLRVHEGERLLVAAALDGAKPESAKIEAGAGQWKNMLGESSTSDLNGARLFRSLPVAVLLAI